MTSDLRIGLIGATGALGSEVLALLAESSLHVKQLVPIGTERSLGQELEFRDLVAPVETDSRTVRYPFISILLLYHGAVGFSAEPP